ncbi:MAG: hypothetical protein ACYDCL_06130 [Myxococcales bacterium]
MNRANPSQIAAEMRRRSDRLRSRSRSGRVKWEDELLCDLDAIEAQARVLSMQQALGRVTESEAAEEAVVLGLAALELRGRYYALLDRERGRGGRRRFG